MKLLLDQGLPRSTAELLRRSGLDAVHVGEVGYSTADDASILKRGLDEGRVVVTLDADFHALLALSGAAFPSVIRLRTEGLKVKRAAKLISEVVERCDEELTKGAVVTVQPGRMRIRFLPLLLG
jgi:predicted nuclease of predicted toxin-antitoxin system